ncbi:hypothetical protein WDW37_01730 [Bdellovibrionota bacterium FG-1]
MKKPQKAMFVLGCVFLIRIMGTQAYGFSTQELPHLELDMDGTEYRALLANSGVQTRGPLQQILDYGKRNLDWLDLINQNRPENNRLELSTPETQVGIPIDHPRESNPTLIQKDFATMQLSLPESVAAVLSGQTPPSAQVPLDDMKFLDIARGVDRVYQAASRWLLQEPALQSYASRSTMDIRGYYFLAKEPELAAKLSNWSSLEPTKRDLLRGWLISECHNSGKSHSACGTALDRSITANGQPLSFHQLYQISARRMFDAFFRIQNSRADSRFDSSGLVFNVPFTHPGEKSVQDWLQLNIEDEWRLQAFHLRLNFISGSFGTPEVVFEPGVTPHVDGLGGNTITMDANRSIQEYTTRWTIRHEFGHVLGYPDCYIEFYDTARKMMINYQIDTDNLMCSRRGKFLQMHLDELKRAY